MVAEDRWHLTGEEGNFIVSSPCSRIAAAPRIKCVLKGRLMLLLMIAAGLVASLGAWAQGFNREQLPQRGAGASGHRVALVIGNGNYQSLAPLANPANDAEDVCAALRSIGFRATCLANVPTRHAFRDAIQTFLADIAPGTETFFFYAGHGLQHRGENYLLPTEAEISSDADIDFEGVALGYLLQSLERARSYPNVIVLDACRDNPFRKNTGFRVETGLARVDPPVGTVLAYSTAPNGAALDGKGRNGLFTKHLLSRLSAPGLQLDEMLRQVASAVENEARTDYRFVQVPYRSSSYSTSHCLAGCEDPTISDRLREIEAQRNELNRKLEQAAIENERLKTQAQKGAEDVARLEERIARLGSESASQGTQNQELERAKAELEAVRAEQTRRDRREQENERTLRELENLRAELQSQAVAMEEYRQRIRELESSRDELRSATPSSKPAKERPQKPHVIVPSF